MTEFCAKVTYGSVAIKDFQRIENGKLVYYAYSIRYDRDGVETSRTEPTRHGSMGGDNGRPFTPQDLKELQNNES